MSLGRLALELAPSPPLDQFVTNTADDCGDKHDSQDGSRDAEDLHL